MALELIPRSMWRWPSIWDDEDDAMLPSVSASSGLSVSEDEKYVYIEAALPGLNAKDIEVTYDKGVLWVKGQATEEEKDKAKKFYRKAARAFSYRVAVPGDIDDKKDPDATYEQGVMKVTFIKRPESQPKKLAVRVK